MKPKEPRQLLLIEINTLATTAVAREFANETMAYFCLQSTLDKPAKYFFSFQANLGHMDNRSDCIDLIVSNLALIQLQVS